MANLDDIDVFIDVSFLFPEYEADVLLQDHLKVLLQRGVAYLNMDSSATSNFTLAIGTSPLLQDAIYEAAKLVSGNLRTHTYTHNTRKHTQAFLGTHVCACMQDVFMNEVH